MVKHFKSRKRKFSKYQGQNRKKKCLGKFFNVAWWKPEETLFKTRPCQSEKIKSTDRV